MRVKRHFNTERVITDAAAPGALRIYIAIKQGKHARTPKLLQVVLKIIQGDTQKFLFRFEKMNYWL